MTESGEATRLKDKLRRYHRALALVREQESVRLLTLLILRVQGQLLTLLN